MAELKQGLFDEAQYPQHKLGELHIDEWGNKYRYVQAGGTALVTGNLLQSAAEDTNFKNMDLAAAVSIGDTMISVTLGGTAVTSNMFEGGELYVSYGTGIGQLFRIVRHDVQSTTTGTCKFYLNRAVKIALTTASSKISVKKNPYDGVIQYPATTQTEAAAGIALYAMQANYYGWVQTGGDAVVLYDTGTNTSNGATGLAPSAAVAGSVKPVADAEGSIVIGFARDVVSTDSYMGLAHLIID